MRTRTRKRETGTKYRRIPIPRRIRSFLEDFFSRGSKMKSGILQQAFGEQSECYDPFLEHRLQRHLYYQYLLVILPQNLYEAVDTRLSLV